MSQGARVESVDALLAFRTALIKFAEMASVALGDAEAEMGRTHMWLETEQSQYWASQVRKRSEIVARCKEAVRMKKLFKDAAGSKPSAVDEEKALAIAQRKLDEAIQKQLNTRRWAQRLQKEIHLYKGQVQRFSTTVHSDVPVAIAMLQKLVLALNAYLDFQATGGSDDQGLAALSNSTQSVFDEAEQSMSRKETQASVLPASASPAPTQQAKTEDDAQGGAGASGNQMSPDSQGATADAAESVDTH